MQIRPDNIQSGTLGIYTQQMERTPAPTERPREVKTSDSGQDRVNFSGEGRLMALAASVAHAAPDVRADRVAQLKAQVEDGTYTVDNTALATAIVRDSL